MYFINENEKLTTTKIGEIINIFRTNELPKMTKYLNYYLGKQEIASKQVNDDTKPCNRIVTNYCNNIVATYNGFMTGKDITYSSDEDITAIQDILNYNDVSSEDSLLLKNALIYGVAYECMWIDADGNQRFTALDPKECIPIYYNTLEQELAYVIRFFVVDNTDLLNSQFYIDVYSAKEKVSYKSDSSFSTFQLLDMVPNFYQQVPVTVFPLNEE